MGTLNPALPTLVDLASRGSAFAVPWGHQEIALISGFDSRRIMEKEGPWTLATPFDYSSTDLAAIIQHDDDGGSVTYRDGLSTHSSSSTEHLSASLAVTVSVPFASGSVSGSYDKMVQETEMGSQASRNTSCRLGRVIVDTLPDFTKEASEILSDWRIDGRARFRELYGDYYVSGYTLGADAGACLSASAHKSTETERTEVTVTVKVLWVEASTTHVEVNTTSTSDASMKFFGYNTFTNDSPCVNVSTKTEDDLNHLRWHVTSYMQQIRKLEGIARRRLKALGLDHGSKMSLTAGSAICNSGLVVQLLLSPYSRLEKYVRLVPLKETVEIMRRMNPDWDKPAASQGRRLQDELQKKLDQREAELKRHEKSQPIL